MNKIVITLDDYLDKSFVYSVLLNKSHIYYGRLKTLFRIPIILTSSVMSVINGSIMPDNEVLKYTNISFNLLTAIILGLSSTLKLEEKHQCFCNAERKFLKLSSKIEQKLMNDTDIITNDYVNEIMNEYDMIVENIDYDIPQFIAKRVRDEYATKKTLPLLINGIKKDIENRSPTLKSVKSMSIDEKKKVGSPCIKAMNTVIEVPEIKSSIAYKEPVVLDVKKIEEVYGVYI